MNSSLIYLTKQFNFYQTLKVVILTIFFLRLVFIQRLLMPLTKSKLVITLT